MHVSCMKDLTLKYMLHSVHTIHCKHRLMF